MPTEAAPTEEHTEAATLTMTAVAGLRRQGPHALPLLQGGPTAHLHDLQGPADPLCVLLHRRDPREEPRALLHPEVAAGEEARNITTYSSLQKQKNNHDIPQYHGYFLPGTNILFFIKKNSHEKNTGNTCNLWCCYTGKGTDH